MSKIVKTYVAPSLSRPITRISIALLAFVAMAFASLVAGIVGVASASPTPVEHTYTPGNPAWGYENDIARWDGQVSYGSGKVMAWSIKLKPAVQELVFGDSMTCNTTIIDLPNYSDYHAGIPADYVLHSSVGNLHDGHQYRLRSICTFQVLTESGLVPGKVETSVNFRV